MAFYIFVGLVVLAVVWLVARSNVMRAWLRGHGSGTASGRIREDGAFQNHHSWNDDG